MAWDLLGMASSLVVSLPEELFSKRSNMATKSRSFIAVALAFGFVATSLVAGEAALKVLDRTKVYYGLADAFTAPAVVEAAKVMETLPAMKTIEGEGLKKNSARYFMLLNEANQQFQKAIKAVAKDQSYDLLAEVGAVTGPKAIPNATDQVIKAAEKTN
jgi:hypothetical protein